jgi:hypothetical protein
VNIHSTSKKSYLEKNELASAAYISGFFHLKHNYYDNIMPFSFGDVACQVTKNGRGHHLATPLHKILDQDP